MLRVVDGYGAVALTTTGIDAGPAGGRITIDCAGLPSGLYFVQLVSAGRTITRPLVVVR